MTQLNTPTASTPPTQPAQVLVLCGLVGSGKTTLAKAIQAQLPVSHPRWPRSLDGLDP